MIDKKIFYMLIFSILIIIVMGLSVIALQGISWSLGKNNDLGRQSKIPADINLQSLHKERIVNGKIIASRFDSLSDGSIWEVYGDGTAELRYEKGTPVFSVITSGNLDYLQRKCRDKGGGQIYSKSGDRYCLATAGENICVNEGYTNPQSCSGGSSGGSSGGNTGGTGGGTTDGGTSGGSCTFPYSSLSQCNSCGYLQTRCFSGNQQELSYANGVCAYQTVGTCGTPPSTPGTPSSTCSDSDGGKTYSIKGTLTDKNNINHQDVCIYSDVQEYYCSDSEYSYVQVNCQYGCFNGACLSSASNIPPVKFLVWNENGQTIPNTPLIMDSSSTYTLPIKIYDIPQSDGDILCVYYNPSHMRQVQPEKYTSPFPVPSNLNTPSSYTPICFSIPVIQDSSRSGKYSYSSNLIVTTSSSYQSSDITLTFFNPSINSLGLGQFVIPSKKSQSTTSKICRDSDGGKSYNTDGYIIGYSGGTYDDFCVYSDNKITIPGTGYPYGESIPTNTEGLVERYCDTSKPDGVGYVFYRCPYGCSNRSCLTSPQSKVLISDAEFMLWDLDGRTITSTNPQMMLSQTRYDLPITLRKIPQNNNNIICVSYNTNYLTRSGGRLKDYSTISEVPSGLSTPPGYTSVCYFIPVVYYTYNSYSYSSDLIVVTGGSYQSTNILLTYFNPSISSSALSQFTLPTVAVSGDPGDIGSDLRFDGVACRTNDQCQSGFCDFSNSKSFLFWVSGVCSQNEPSQPDLTETENIRSSVTTQPTPQQTPLDNIPAPKRSTPPPQNIIAQFFDFIASLFRR